MFQDIESIRKTRLPFQPHPTPYCPRTIPRWVYKEPDAKQIRGLASEDAVQLMSRAKWISIHLSIFTKVLGCRLVDFWRHWSRYSQISFQNRGVS